MDDLASTQERQQLRLEVERIQEALQGSAVDNFDVEYESDDDEHKTEDVVHNTDVEDDDISDENSHLSSELPVPCSSDFQVIPDESTVESIIGHVADGRYEATPEICLALNQTYQDAILENLNRIDLVLEQNRERQKMLEDELAEQTYGTEDKAGKKKTMSIYCVPYIKDVNGHGAPPNDHVLAIKKLRIQSPFLSLPKSWTETEKKALVDGVRSDAIKKLIQPLLSRCEVENNKREQLDMVKVQDNQTEETVDEKARNEEKREEEKKEVEQTIADLEKKIQSLKKTKDKELFKDPNDENFLKSLDWLKISTISLKGEFTDIECQLAWRNLIHPELNLTKWTATEDAKLLELTETLEDWVSIAKEMNTNRTAFMCLQRYQQKHSSLIDIRPWNTEEEDFLKEIVETCRIGDYVPWSQVTYYMDGRSREQCKLKWDKIDDNDRRRGRFKPKEDEKLKRIVKTYGAKNWSLVATHMVGRTSNQCRERWTNSLDPKVKIGNWTYQEDRKLLGLIGQLKKGKWAEIARHLPGRTDNMLLQRYRKLMKWKSENDWFDKQKVQIRQYIQVCAKHELISKIKELSRVNDQEIKRMELKLRMALVEEEQSGVYSWGNNQSQFSLFDTSKSQAIKKKVQCLREKRKLYFVQFQDRLKAIDHKHDHMRQTRAEEELQLADLNKGIVIPRPLPVEFQNLMKKNQQTLKLDRINRAKKLPKAEITKGKLHPKDLVSVANNILKKNENLRKQEENAVWESQCVERDIAILFSPSMAHRSVGRPRKFLASDGFTRTNSKGLVIDKKQEEKTIMNVVPIIAKAVDLDLANSSQNAMAVRKYFNARKRTFDDSNEANKVVEVVIDEEDNQSVKQVISLPPIKKKRGPKKKVKPQEKKLPTEEKQEEPVDGKLVLPGAALLKTKLEQDLMIFHSVFESSDEGSSSEDEEYNLYVEALETIKKIKPGVNDQMQVLRRAVSSEGILSFLASQGQLVIKREDVATGSVSMDMPPLPPTVSTLNAFKQLLLNRRQLTQVADDFKVPFNESCFIKVKLKSHQTSEGMAHMYTYKPHPIKAIRNQPEYQLLKKRFVSQFTWPAVLSSLDTTDIDTKRKLQKAGNLAKDAEVSNGDNETQIPDADMPRKKYKYPCMGGKRRRKYILLSKEEKEARMKKYVPKKFRKDTDGQLLVKKSESEATVTKEWTGRPKRTNARDWTSLVKPRALPTRRRSSQD